MDNKNWIPQDFRDLQSSQLLGLYIVEKVVTRENGPEVFNKWKYTCKCFKKDCEYFVQSFIHYIISRAGSKIPRTLSTNLHGSRPNEVVRF